MADELVQFSKFASLYNKSTDAQAVALSDIQSLENILKIKFPSDFKLFTNKYGNLWTPHILDIIVDNGIGMNDIQQFWLPEEIIEDKESGLTHQIEKEVLVPFASDCMGNIYAFKSHDLKTLKPTANVYFFDLDFNEIYLMANSFTALIEKFNSLA
jgi:hypothetical protein